PLNSRGLAILAEIPRPAAPRRKERNLLDNLSQGLSSAAAPRRTSQAQRAWRIQQSYRVSAYSFLPHSSRTTVLVLCLNLGRTYTLHCRRKSKSCLEMLGFSCQCLVLVRAELDSLSAGQEAVTKTY